MRLLIISCLACFGIAAVSADEPAKTNRPDSAARPTTEETSIKKERYLGVVTEPVTEAMATQLKDVLAAGRGLLVRRVLPDSPAAKADVQPFDVLSSADAKPLTTPEQLKDVVTSQPAGRALKLEYIRGAKAHVVDVLPAERSVSRMVHRHFGPGGKEEAESLAKRAKSEGQSDIPAYSVGVKTRDGRQFQVEVRLTESKDAPAQKYAGSVTDIAARIKTLPEPVQRSIRRQMASIAEDRGTLRTVQFRFQPQRDGNRQLLTVTLKKPDADGAVKSFELQQPMGDAAKPMSLEAVLQVPEFAAQLKELDPAVQEKIASTLKTASLPAGTLKVEGSQ
jgi:hypothetical protein